jgi:hypothetical protein
MRRKDAKVSWKALMSHVDSLSVISRLSASEGMAEYRAAVLKPSRNMARQKTIRRKDRRVTEYRWGTLSSMKVCTGERERSFAFSGGANIVACAARERK